MEASIEIAQSLFKQNKYQETIDTCKKILTTDINSIEALKLIAKSFLATRNVEDARLYLNKALERKTATKTQAEVTKRIRILTDFQFFVEIYAIYREYLSKDLRVKIKKILGNKSCKISNVITEEITSLLAKLPDIVKQNIPDNFYHIRHDTLICSKDKQLVKKRIKLLRGIYEGFDSNKCLGKKDGISGCRDCCSDKYPKNYRNCVNLCMNY